MCTDCLVKGAIASVSAGIALTLVVSAAAYQWANPPLSADWMSTVKNLLKYAVGFFLLGVAKWQMHEGIQKHMQSKKKK